MPLRSFSRRTRSVPDDAPQDQPLPDQSPPRRNRRRRGLRVLAAAALTVVGLVLASTLANLVIEGVERANSTAYGERIPTAHGTINVSRTGETGPTLLLLSGLGTPAPALDFAPLIRELHGYRIVVVEGGYGPLSSCRPLDRGLHHPVLRQQISAGSVCRQRVPGGHKVRASLEDDPTDKT